jgi:glycosyltransferase involved in cell wall biosynthesis
MRRDSIAAGDVAVCLVGPFPPPIGGMSVQAAKLATLLLREGVITVSVPVNPQPPRMLSFVNGVPAVRTLVREVQYLASLVKILPKATVVHHLSASGLSFFLQSVPLLCMGRALNKKIIVNYRGGNAGRFLRRWSALAVPLLRLAGEVAVPSQYLQRVFAEHGITAQLLPNIADTDLFPYRERQVYLSRLIVTRHLEPMYNIDGIIRAFVIVQRRFPEAMLAIVGSGSEETRLKKLAVNLGLHNVIFHGLVSPENLPALYSQYDIYVNASSVDNFPGALVEAACSGLPIVSTRAGGIPDMIRHRETGLLVDVGDHVGLANSVIQLVEEPQEAGKLARSARLWAEQFAWKNVFPLLSEYYGLRTPDSAYAQGKC